MHSAYAILGVHGNASTEEIHQAFQMASSHFSRDKLAENPALVDRLHEIRDAYKILSTPDMRRAHDRKLNASVETPTIHPRVVLEKEAPRVGKPLPLLAIVLVAMFLTGMYFSYSRVQARKAQVAQELAQKQREAEAAAQEARDAAQVDAEKASADMFAEYQERQLRSESVAVTRQNGPMESQRQTMMDR